MPDDEVQRSHCNECLRETKHVVRKSISRSVDLEDEHELIVQSDLLECCGCESSTMKITEEYTIEGISVDVEEFYYPPRISKSTPIWSTTLPLGPKTLLKEIYAALHADSRQLTVMGARALIEMVMIDAVGDQGSFRRNLDAFEAKGLVAKAQREFLESAIEAGHAAMHRQQELDADQVTSVIEIVENLLETVYVLPRRSTNLRNSIPRRVQTTNKIQ